MAIRVCQLITELRPAGAERCVLELATRLPALGVEVEVAALRGGAVADQLRRAGVPTHVLDLRARCDVRALVRLIAVLRNGRYDVLHTHLFHADVAGQLARCWSPPIRLVHTVHVAERRFRPWHFAWARARAGAYDRVVCVSRGVRDFHAARARLPARLYHVIHNAVDLNRHSRDDQRGRLTRRQFEIADQQVLCLFVGRLDEQKGIADLLEAFALACGRDDRLRLVIAGDGPLHVPTALRITRADLAGKVRMPGFVEDVPGLLSAADMLVLPSRWEGFGLAAAEAMAAELPVVATNVTGLNEVVAHGRTGLLCPPGDLPALSGAILQLAGDESLRRRLGREGLARAQRLFGIDRYICRHAELYGQVIKNTSHFGM